MIYNSYCSGHQLVLGQDYPSVKVGKRPPGANDSQCTSGTFLKVKIAGNFLYENLQEDIIIIIRCI